MKKNNKLINVQTAKNILFELENQKDILHLNSKRSCSITIQREIDAMKTILKDKTDDEVLNLVFSKSFLDMKKVYKL